MPPKKPNGKFTDATTGRTVEAPVAKSEIKRPEAPPMPEGYTHIRNGIFEHTAMQDGMSTKDYCVYTTLLRFADFRTGICMTNALSIASHWNDITGNYASQCMGRLRKKDYINYPSGTGKRGVFPVVIDKYEPGGNLLGWRLNLRGTFDFFNPTYEWVSPTPLTQAYTPEELEWMTTTRDWMYDLLADAMKRLNPDSSFTGIEIEGGGRTLIERSSNTHRILIERSSNAHRTLVEYSSNLYTASLLNYVMESRKNCLTASLGGENSPSLPKDKKPDGTSNGKEPTRCDTCGCWPQVMEGLTPAQIEERCDCSCHYELQFLPEPTGSTFNIEGEDDDLA